MKNTKWAGLALKKKTATGTPTAPSREARNNGKLKLPAILATIVAGGLFLPLTGCETPNDPEYRPNRQPAAFADEETWTEHGARNRPDPGNTVPVTGENRRVGNEFVWN